MSDIRIQKTGEPDILQTSDGRLTLSVPIQIKRRSGRKLGRVAVAGTEVDVLVLDDKALAGG